MTSTHFEGIENTVVVIPPCAKGRNKMPERLLCYQNEPQKRMKEEHKYTVGGGVKYVRTKSL